MERSANWMQQLVVQQAGSLYTGGAPAAAADPLPTEQDQDDLLRIASVESHAHG
jgi:hypothetical protein